MAQFFLGYKKRFLIIDAKLSTLLDVPFQVNSAMAGCRSRKFGLFHIYRSSQEKFRAQGASKRATTRGFK